MTPFVFSKISPTFSSSSHSLSFAKRMKCSVATLITALATHGPLANGSLFVSFLVVAGATGDLFCSTSAAPVSQLTMSLSLTC